MCSLRATLSREGVSDGRRAQTEGVLAALLEQEPEHDYAVVLCINAWCDLSSCRTIGMAAGPIPWTAIVAWCEFHELDRDATMIMIHVIRTLDNERAEREAAEQAKKEALGGNR